VIAEIFLLHRLQEETKAKFIKAKVDGIKKKNGIGISRSDELIVPSVGYANNNGGLNNDHWAYRVPYAFRDALDIKFSSRSIGKQLTNSWTQGCLLMFSEGDFFESLSGGKSIQISFATPMAWDGKITGVFDSGIVGYQFFDKHGLGEFFTVSQMEFLQLLIYGEILQDIPIDADKANVIAGKPMVFGNKMIDRSMDELIGICKGILFDGSVSETQVYRLCQWFDANPYIKRTIIGNDLYALLVTMEHKDKLSIEDQCLLLDFFSKLSGSVEILNSGYNPSCKLPLTDPAPVVIFSGKLFVLTGNFKIGNRAKVISLIENLGGQVSPKTVNCYTDYLVIGDVGSMAWVHSSYGRKIEHAMELQQEGCDIAIISEAHFMRSLTNE